MSEKIWSREEQVQPQMDTLLEENGLQITLQTLVKALDNLMAKRGKDVEGIMVREGLNGLLKGYKKRYEGVKEEDD